jgi:hypothetical protein
VSSVGVKNRKRSGCAVDGLKQCVARANVLVCGEERMRSGLTARVQILEKEIKTLEAEKAEGIRALEAAKRQLQEESAKVSSARSKLADVCSTHTGSLLMSRFDVMEFHDLKTSSREARRMLYEARNRLYEWSEVLVQKADESFTRSAITASMKTPASLLAGPLEFWVPEFLSDEPSLTSRCFC